MALGFGAIRRTVGKVPGMNAVGRTVNKVPGVQPMTNRLGLGPSRPPTPQTPQQANPMTPQPQQSGMGQMMPPWAGGGMNRGFGPRISPWGQMTGAIGNTFRSPMQGGGNQPPWMQSMAGPMQNRASMMQPNMAPANAPEVQNAPEGESPAAAYGQADNAQAAPLIGPSQDMMDRIRQMGMAGRGPTGLGGSLPYAGAPNWMRPQ